MTEPIEFWPNSVREMAVMGTSFHQHLLPPAGTWSFHLVAETNNPHDENAVAVKAGANVLGHLPADVAPPYSHFLQKLAATGRVFWVKGEVFPDDGRGRFIRILIPPEKDLRAWESDQAGSSPKRLAGATASKKAGAARTTRISFEPDLVSLAIADQLAIEQGLTLEEIAAEAFSAYMQGVLDARGLDLDEGARSVPDDI